MDGVRSRLRYALLALLGALMIGSAGYLLLRRPAPTVLLVQPAQRVQPTSLPPVTIEKWVCCHISGAVVAAGVYTLPVGARVQDAIRAAGGPVAGAELAGVNLAALVRDQDHIIVPRAAIAPTPDAAGSKRSPGLLLVDINSAGRDALQTLPGIGPVLAERILQYRSEFGPFGSAKDLIAVSGIGEKKLAELLPFVIAGP